MSPGTIRVRVTVTVETAVGKASASSSAEATYPNDFAVGEMQSFAAEQARRRTAQLIGSLRRADPGQ